MEDALFEQLTEYLNHSDNLQDNLRRAELLGLGGRNIRIAPAAVVRVRQPEQLGSDLFIGLYSYLNGDITIGDHTLIGPHCSLTAGHHLFDAETGWFSARTQENNRIVIGEGCWLASGVTVTAGVTVGRCNLLCANAVITKNTPDYAIMAGVPARQVGYIDAKSGEYVWHSRQE